MAEVRLVSRWTGSTVIVPEEKAKSLADLGFETEQPKKSTAKKSSSAAKK
jgi:hypothetical protein